MLRSLLKSTRLEVLSISLVQQISVTRRRSQNAETIWRCADGFDSAKILESFEMDLLGILRVPKGLTMAKLVCVEFSGDFIF